MSDLNEYLAAHQRGDATEAERGYRLLMASSGEHAIAARRLLSVLLLQQSRDREALELLDAVVCEQPSDAEARTNLAIALRRNGRIADAVSQARIAVDAAPERPAAWNALGLSLLDTGELEQAVQVFEQAIEQHPGVAAFRLHLGQARSAAQDLSGAEAAFLAALALSPEIAEAWRCLGRVQIRLARYREAIGAYQRAAALIGPEPEFAIEFGAALCAAGMHEQGQALLRGALQALPDSSDGWLWLGRSLLFQDRSAEASDALARAASLAPGNTAVSELLAVARGELAGSGDSA
jgi:tetratricopeptide (TPR) repeat protein